jgi:type IV fimbrial biogenesis protein FimT
MNKPNFINDPFCTERGFTLIELLVAVAVLAVLLGIGVPSFKTIIATTRVKNASFDVFSSIVAARSEAIARNTTVTITPVGGDWAGGWDVIATTASGNVTVKKQDALTNLTIKCPNSPCADSVAYSNTGRLTTAATPITLTASGVNDTEGRCITIDLSGRPVVAKGVCP